MFQAVHLEVDFYEVEVDTERVPVHTSNHCIYWTRRQRAWPSRKLSKVDFIAVLAALFTDQILEPHTTDDESLKKALKRDGSIRRGSGDKTTSRDERRFATLPSMEETITHGIKTYETLH